MIDLSSITKMWEKLSKIQSQMKKNIFLKKLFELGNQKQ